MAVDKTILMIILVLIEVDKILINFIANYGKPKM